MKQCIVLRTDLAMSTGKLVAQACHASVGAMVRATRPLLERWFIEGQTKVALEVESELELNNLQQRCVELGLAHALISDAGRTELDPGTVTALGIGPAEDDLVNQVTGSLRLLK
jgi:PTH2 family peptidyl-tRNA hydrolase